MPIRSEERIRRLADVLEYAAIAPCDCLQRGPTHALNCVVGAANMNAARLALLWVLGAENLHAGMMNDEELQKNVSKWIGSGKKVFPK